MASFEETKINFRMKLSQLITRIPMMKGKLSTEESTKNSLIMPMISCLGYDVFNPEEVNPEYTADFGTKTKEKVDYAIMKDGKPIILVECKPIDTKLGDKQTGQLYRYFSVSEAKIGILTNGLEYWFFSDLEEDNKMDKKPFYIANLEKLTDEDYSHLAKLHKDVFDIDNIVSRGQELKEIGELKEIILAEIANPSEEFVNILVKRFYEGRMTKKALDRYIPLVRIAFNQIVFDKLNSKVQAVQTSINNDGKEEIKETKEESAIVTTEDEITGFMIVRAISSKVCPIERVVMRDAQSYCAVLFDDNNRKPIIRMHFNSPTVKYISTFKEGVDTKVKVNGPNDIYNYQEQIIETINGYLNKH